MACKGRHPLEQPQLDILTMQLMYSLVAQFIGDCSSSKMVPTNPCDEFPPFLARLATVGSSAAYKIISACSNAVDDESCAERLKEPHIARQIRFAHAPKYPHIGLQQ